MIGRGSSLGPDPGVLRATFCPSFWRGKIKLRLPLSLKSARFWKTPRTVSLTVSWPWPCCLLAIGHVPLPRGSPQSHCLSRAPVWMLLSCMFSVSDLVRVAHHHHSPCGNSCALLHPYLGSYTLRPVKWCWLWLVPYAAGCEESGLA